MFHFEGEKILGHPNGEHESNRYLVITIVTKEVMPCPINGS